ncbi:Melanoma inhibitory activity protein 3 [Sciurus carolinensis]|uniref:Melanoma inhibitory activity protein 3 n=1 Tax=Sciurus carolinensis TaxID=30640 RepID=A0AA41T3F8_SCICA|nr:Melanoma inhibitory activity protein 3 [Sciurus carolinensis]
MCRSKKQYIKIKESKKHVHETKKQNMVLSDAGMKYKDKIKLLEETNEILEDRAKSLHVVLESQREQNVNNEDLVQIALNEAKLSEYKVKCECHRVQEENARLKKKKEQALTNYITQLNRIELESECEGQNEGGGESDELANGEVGGDQSAKVKIRIKQLMDISRV